MIFKENKPIYLQIADRIMDEILQGVFHEEGRILSVREYAAAVEVNANTVVRSFDYLQNQSVIFNRRGIGYFVCAGARQTILALRRKVFMEEELPEMFRKIRLLDIPISDVVKLYDGFENDK